MNRGAVITNTIVMKDYRVRIRAERMGFFEELMRSLDFCDYVRVEEEGGAMTNSRLKYLPQQEKKTSKSKSSGRRQIESPDNFRESVDNLREVISKIEARRDLNRRKKG